MGLSTESEPSRAARRALGGDCASVVDATAPAPARPVSLAKKGTPSFDGVPALFFFSKVFEPRSDVFEPILDRLVPLVLLLEFRRHVVRAERH
jgi:hypothetical protein